MKRSCIYIYSPSTCPFPGSFPFSVISQFFWCLWLKFELYIASTDFVTCVRQWRTVGQVSLVVNIEMALQPQHRGFVQVMFEKHPELILGLDDALCQEN